MRLRPVAAIGAVLTLWFTPALAGSDDVLLKAMANCAAVSSDAARLACYDGLAPRVRSAMAAPNAQAAPAPKEAAAPTKEEEKSWFGFDMGDLFGSTPQTQTTPAQFGAEKTAAAQTRRETALREIDSITAGVTNYAFNPFGKFIVMLDNGQIWSQLEADDSQAKFLRNPAANTVKIERGMLGSYVLSVNGGNRGYKVTRVK